MWFSRLQLGCICRTCRTSKMVCSSHSPSRSRHKMQTDRIIRSRDHPQPRLGVQAFLCRSRLMDQFCVNGIVWTRSVKGENIELVIFVLVVVICSEDLQTIWLVIVSHLIWLKFESWFVPVATSFVDGQVPVTQQLTFTTLVLILVQGS